MGRADRTNDSMERSRPAFRFCDVFDFFGRRSSSWRLRPFLFHHWNYRLRALQYDELPLRFAHHCSHSWRCISDRSKWCIGHAVDDHRLWFYVYLLHDHALQQHYQSDSSAMPILQHGTLFKFWNRVRFDAFFVPYHRAYLPRHHFDLPRQLLLRG